jgi:hypothetical protein
VEISDAYLPMLDKGAAACHTIRVKHREDQLAFDFSSHLQPIYDYVESKNEGLQATPEIVALLKQLDDIYDELNQLEN